MHCYACDGYYPSDNFGNNRHRCKVCDYEKSQSYLKKHPEKVKLYKQKFYPKLKKYREKLVKKEVENLEDSYVRRILARYSVHPESWFTKEMVIAKRAQLKLNRALREARKERG